MMSTGTTNNPTTITPNERSTDVNLSLSGHYGVRLAKAMKTLPSSALESAQWAKRNLSSNTVTEPNESLGLDRTTSSSNGISTHWLPREPRSLFSSSSTISNKGVNRGSTSGISALLDKKIKHSSSSTSREEASTSSSGSRGPNGLFATPAVRVPKKQVASAPVPQAEKYKFNTSIIDDMPESSSSSSRMRSRKRTISDRSSASKTEHILTPNRPEEDEKGPTDLETDDNEVDQDDLLSHDHSTADESNQVILSLCWARGKLGAAFYHINTSQIYFMEDKIESAPEFWVLRTLFREQKPRWVIVGGLQDDRFFCAIRELCGVPDTTPLTSKTSRQQEQNDSFSSGDEQSASPTSSSSEIRGSCTIRVLPMSDFKYELCQRRVLSMVLPNEPEGVTETERELFVRGKVNTDLIQMTRAMGALLRFIDKHGMNMLSPLALMDGPSVLGLHVYAMETLTHLDEATTYALQLFSEDHHPAASKSGKSSASKEGLSIYALLSRTACPMSSPVLRKIILRPTTDVEVLDARYALVEWGVEPANMETLRNLQASMKKITNVPHVINRLRRGQLNIRDWKVLYYSLFNAIIVGELCKVQNQDIPIFRETASCLTEGIYHASFLIQRIMDIEQSEREYRFVVKPGVDTELDDKKRQFNGLGDMMLRVAEMELTRLPPEVESCMLTYLPHVGYLLAFSPTPLLAQTLPAQNYQLPGLKFMFNTTDLILYKSFTCCEMDRELGDILVEIANHETRIMIRLVAALLQQVQTFSALVSNILILDCLLAFAIVTREFGWVRPELTGDPVLEVENARHPLQELCTTTFVANPVRSGPPGACVTLITGPNASGKTVYMKQIGVLAVLAQIGCWVPASRARLKPMDAIITVTQTTPSVTSSLSAFMLELSRMCIALDRATNRSLVIIDEFGTATYENDGAAILTACLDYWCQRNDPRYSTPISQDRAGPYSAPPHIFVSTHLLQVYDHLHYKDAVRCMAMEFVEEDGSMVPLYQVTDGRAKKSYAASVALLAGVPKDVIDRANEVYECIRKGNLPSRCHFVENKEEQRRSEEVVSALLSCDLDNDPVEDILAKIKLCGLGTPSLAGSKCQTTTSPKTSTCQTPTSPKTSTCQTPKSPKTSTTSKRSTTDARKARSSSSSSSATREDVTLDKTATPCNLEVTDKSYSSSIPLHYKVEAVLSAGTTSSRCNFLPRSEFRSTPYDKDKRQNVRNSYEKSQKSFKKSTSSSSFEGKEPMGTSSTSHQVQGTSKFSSSISHEGFSESDYAKQGTTKNSSIFSPDQGPLKISQLRQSKSNSNSIISSDQGLHKIASKSDSIFSLYSESPKMSNAKQSTSESNSITSRGHGTLKMTSTYRTSSKVSPLSTSYSRQSASQTSSISSHDPGAEEISNVKLSYSKTCSISSPDHAISEMTYMKQKVSEISQIPSSDPAYIKLNTSKTSQISSSDPAYIKLNTSFKAHAKPDISKISSIFSPDASSSVGSDTDHGISELTYMKQKVSEISQIPSSDPAYIKLNTSKTSQISSSDPAYIKLNTSFKAHAKPDISKISSIFSPDASSSVGSDTDHAISELTYMKQKVSEISQIPSSDPAYIKLNTSKTSQISSSDPAYIKLNTSFKAHAKPDISKISSIFSPDASSSVGSDTDHGISELTYMKQKVSEISQIPSSDPAYIKLNTSKTSQISSSDPAYIKLNTSFKAHAKPDISKISSIFSPDASSSVGSDTDHAISELTYMKQKVSEISQIPSSDPAYIKLNTSKTSQISSSDPAYIKLNTFFKAHAKPDISKISSIFSPDASSSVGSDTSTVTYNQKKSQRTFQQLSTRSALLDEERLTIGQISSSDSDISYSQESMVLQRNWSIKHIPRTTQSHTQGFQVSSTIDIEF